MDPGDFVYVRRSCHEADRAPTFIVDDEPEYDATFVENGTAVLILRPHDIYDVRYVRVLVCGRVRLMFVEDLERVW